jgi:large subunit ribosomal protein L9
MLPFGGSDLEALIMQVILLHDVDRVGHEGELLKVADGYARNFLIPRGFAVPATKGTLKDLEARRVSIERKDGEKRDAALKIAEDLRGKTILVKHVTGEGTKLHGTVTTQQIAEAAKAQLGLNLDKRDLELGEPIREIGDYLVSARIYKDVTAQLPIRVVSDKWVEADAELEEALNAAAAHVAPAAPVEAE